MIYRIGKELIFPQPVDVEPDGLLCVGGDLSVDRLLLAYSHGIFPWFSFRDYDEPLWYCPQERFVIFPNEIHVSHSMRTLINKGKYDVSIGDDFDGVIRGCQKPTDATTRKGRGLARTSSAHTPSCTARTLRRAWRCGRATDSWADSTA